jgi:signal peptidase I
MEPTIGLGSAIVIHAVEPAALKVDDIVSMRVGPAQTTFTHRIVAVIDREDGRWIRTKGDANGAPDPTLVPATAVIGRVELVVPFAGYLLAILAVPTGVMFVLGLAATLLAVAWLLESLEPEPRLVRRPGEPGAVDGVPNWPVPSEPRGPVLDPEPDRGEPIAVRRAGIANSIEPGDPHPVGGPRRVGRAHRIGGAWALAAPIQAHSKAASVARPTVREQLERSREVRNQRARWQAGRGAAAGTARE